LYVGEITSNLGNLLGFDKKFTQTSNQHFFIALEAGEEWETSFGVVNKITNETIFVIIDYNYLLIRCWFCLEPSFITLKGQNVKTSKLGKGEHVYKDNEQWK
jgi:hypothetical protein